jgi:hypothetical protein
MDNKPSSLNKMGKPMTPKQKVVQFLEERSEKFSKASTLNSLVERFFEMYPDFFKGMNLVKGQSNINLEDKESITSFDQNHDDYTTDEDATFDMTKFRPFSELLSENELAKGKQPVEGSNVSKKEPAKKQEKKPLPLPQPKQPEPKVTEPEPEVISSPVEPVCTCQCVCYWVAKENAHLRARLDLLEQSRSKTITLTFNL